jgi:hypothetical protein
LLCPNCRDWPDLAPDRSAARVGSSRTIDGVVELKRFTNPQFCWLFCVSRQKLATSRRIADEVEGLYEDWMVHADQVMADDEIVMAAYEALAKRHRLSRTRSRRGFAAEVVVRLLVLKHARNGAQTRTKEALVPLWPEMANGIRGSHLRDQA